MAAWTGERQGEPTFRASDHSSLAIESLQRWWRRWRVRVVLAALAVVLVVMTAVQKLWIDPQLTAVKFRVTLIGQSDGPVFEIDDEAGVVAVRGAQRGAERFVLIGERVYLPATVVDPSADPEKWLSFPAEAVMEDPKVFSIQHLLNSFDVDTKECELPDNDADAIVKATLVQTFAPGADEHRYNICGSSISGGGFVDGRSVRVQDERIRPSEVFRPSADVVTAVEDMGENASALTALAAESFRSEGHPQG